MIIAQSQHSMIIAFFAFGLPGLNVGSLAAKDTAHCGVSPLTQQQTGGIHQLFSPYNQLLL